MGKWGSLPMNGQISCEGPQGKTSLFDGPPKPAPLRTDMFGDPAWKPGAEGSVDPSSVKEHMCY